MGWRKMMGTETENTISNPKSNNSNIRNIKGNDPIKTNIALIADIAPKNQKVKTHQQQHDDLWQKAWKLADWIDDSQSDIPWHERAARVPELQRMSMMLSELEVLINRQKGGSTT